jgi:hypothetical protein
VKGKIWRSLDLANQSNVNSNYSPNNHPTTSGSNATNVHHNSLINANQNPHYQRHDFKNRRSSSEPANEQKMLAHIQTNSTTSSTTQNTTAITNTPNSNSNNNQTNSSLVIDGRGDDFIDCLHQKNIQKVSKFKRTRILKFVFLLFSRLSKYFSFCY